MKLPRKLQKEIVGFLSSVPTMHDSESQRAFIYQVGIEQELQNQIVFGRPPVEFVPLLVSTLLKYGRLNEGRHALEAVLETAKDYVGQDKKTFCDELLQKLHVNIDRTEGSESKSQWKFLNREKSLVFLIMLVCVGIGTVIYLLYYHNGNINVQNDAVENPEIDDGNYYEVTLIIPSTMEGATITVDNKPAQILSQMPTAITIRVKKAISGHHIVLKKDSRICSMEMLILQDQKIYPCQ